MGQHWIGTTDVNHLLRWIGGWHVRSQAATDANAAIAYAVARGWITVRLHYSPAIPEGQLAYEVTDAGIRRVRLELGEAHAEATEAMRQWYRTLARLHKAAKL